jgi:hypothetical protein
VSGGKALTFDNDILKLIFQGIGIPNIADNAASAPLQYIYLSLHTADPGVNGFQNQWEATYGGYARVAVARSPTGWNVAGNVVNPSAPISFPVCVSGAETETWVAAGTDPSGQGKILYRGPLTPAIPVVIGVTPQLTQASAFTES